MGKSWNHSYDDYGYAKGSWKEDDAELDKYKMRGGVDPRDFLEYYGDEDDLDVYEDIISEDEEWNDKNTDEKEPVVYTFG